MDQIAAGDGEDQTLDGGAGNDTLWAGDGENTLFGGEGDDRFELDSTTGNDTVVGGLGENTIDFNDRASTDVDSIETVAGTTTITFTDGQIITTTQIQELVFSDTTQTIP